MVGKFLVSAFQNFFRIENLLNIKKVISKKMFVCILSLWSIIYSIDIFDTFDMSNKMSNSVCSVALKLQTPSSMSLTYIAFNALKSVAYLQHLQHCFDLCMYTIKCIQCYVCCVSQCLQHKTMCIDTYWHAPFNVHTTDKVTIITVSGFLTI